MKGLLFYRFFSFCILGGFLLNLKSLDVVIEADLPPKSKSLHVSLITTKCQSIKKLPPLALLLSRAQSSRGRVWACRVGLPPVSFITGVPVTATLRP